MKFHIVTLPGAQYAWGFHRRYRLLASCAPDWPMTYRVKTDVAGSIRERVVCAEELEATVGRIFQTWPQAMVSIAPSMDEPSSSPSPTSAAEVLPLHSSSAEEVLAEAA